MIREALDLAGELWALVRQGIIERRQADRHFASVYGIALYPVRYTKLKGRRAVEDPKAKKKASRPK